MWVGRLSAVSDLVRNVPHEDSLWYQSSMSTAGCDFLLTVL